MNNTMEACQSCFGSLSKLNINGETEFAKTPSPNIYCRINLMADKIEILSLDQGIKNTLAVPCYGDGIRCNTMELLNIS